MLKCRHKARLLAFTASTVMLMLSRSSHAKGGLEGIAWWIYDFIDNAELGIALYTVAVGIVGASLTFFSIRLFKIIRESGGDTFQKIGALILFLIGIVLQVPYVIIWRIYYVNDMYKHADIGLIISIAVFILVNGIGVYLYQRRSKTK